VAPVGAPGSSILQSAHAKPRTPAEEAAQRKQAGDAAMDALNYADALAAYTEAYALSKDPALLYNKGRVLQALARYPEALEQLEAFDHEAPPELRAKVPALAALLAEIRAKVSRLRLVANVSDARVLVRGSVVGKTPLAAPLALTAGPARVAVEAEGYFPFERELTLPGGETLELRAELVSRATTALLRVSADAKGASVWVDGKSLGAAPSESFVGAGRSRDRRARRGSSRRRAARGRERGGAQRGPRAPARARGVDALVVLDRRRRGRPGRRRHRHRGDERARRRAGGHQPRPGERAARARAAVLRWSEGSRRPEGARRGATGPGPGSRLAGDPSPARNADVATARR
jgi:hypothetical protein